MADNINDDTSDNPITPQSENLSGEIISVTDTDTIIPNQETQNMEVHHHPDLHHKPKKWKEYFLEFLMIFLAVTLGFFAENLREHIKEKAVIQNNMESMIADLQSDVAMYNSTLTANQFSDKRTDTLITLLKKDRTSTSEIYFLARFITANNQNYSPITKTFDQMKSSGTLKLIEPSRLLDSISEYYQSLQYFPGVNNLQNQKLTDIHLANSQLFDGYTFQNMFIVVPTKFGFVKGEIKMPEGNPPLLSDNFKAINSVIMAYHYLYSVTEVNNNAAIIRKENANRLINLLIKEYDLK